jgi:hypothetical protein
MRRKARFYYLLAAVIVAALALAPAPALAQHGHGPGPGHPGGGGHVYVGVGAGWAYPYWGWGPYWGLGWGAYWGWGGPWYGYPWAYYPGYGPPDDSASVKLEVTPKDAQVYVDGNFLGTVDDFDGMFQKLHVPPGDRELVIFKQGFRTVKQTVRLRPGQDVKIRYALEPLAAGETSEPPPPPPKREEPVQRTAPPFRPAPEVGEPAPPSTGIEARAFGALVFRVQPAGAEILIDGERWQGPEGEDRLVVQVAQGSHRVEIRKDGFVTFTQEVTVRGGETTPLNVSLPPRGE